MSDAPPVRIPDDIEPGFQSKTDAEGVPCGSMSATEADLGECELAEQSRVQPAPEAPIRCSSFDRIKLESSSGVVSENVVVSGASSATSSVKEWVYEALSDPWVTNPDVLLKAVNAVRTMPQVDSPHDQYTRWMEEGLNYPVARPSTANAKDAAIGAAGHSVGGPTKSHFLKRSRSLKLTSHDDGHGQLQRERPSSSFSSKLTLKRSASLRSQPRGGAHNDGDSVPLARVLRQPSVRPPPLMLRQMFLDQALSYIGTPYIRAPGTLGKASCKQLPSRLKSAAPVPGAHDKWNLALDCSALIRQCLFDLQRYFGFCIGGWNQAYQFDTLPIEVDSIENMLPGDLIFISGKYFDQSRTAKPHDMTHVEIFFPFGQYGSTQTIGSRHRHGCVQIHKDFRFESKTYYDMQYHLRSIDTWLQGTCRSHCKAHRWQNG